MEKIRKSDEEWKQELDPEQYRVMRCSGTEPPFTGKYVHHEEKGTYRCAGCGQELFSSESKYDSGSGWPSFWEPLEATRIEEHLDTSYGMQRTEIRCARCDAHLGHVFPDGPPPTGLRYCVNSIALDFRAAEEG